MNARNALAAGLFLTGLVINPAYFLGCAGEEKELKFDYGETEMLSLLDDINEADAWFVLSDGIEYRVQVSLAQIASDDAETAAADPTRRAWMQRAHACGNKERVFGATAAACATLYLTTVPVEGTLRILTSADAESSVLKEVTVSGELQVVSPVFASGEVRLHVEAADAVLSLQGKTLTGFYGGAFMSSDIDASGLDVSGQVRFPSE